MSVVQWFRCFGCKMKFILEDRVVVKDYSLRSFCKDCAEYWESIE